VRTDLYLKAQQYASQLRGDAGCWRGAGCRRGVLWADPVDFLGDWFFFFAPPIVVG
jgi:hypothetical protein